MKIISGKRSSGKSIRLIKEAASNFSYIVCANRKRVRYISEWAKAFGYDMPFPITYDEFLLAKFTGTRIKSFVIDDVDDLLRYIARGVPVKAFTYSVDEEDSEEELELAKELMEEDEH